ncbi:hypothetical protein Tco_0180860 [Tanacetum coccineum]
MTELPLPNLGFAVPVFSQRDDPIACLNKAMAFLTAVASSRFPSTNNQLRTSSNPRTKPLFKMEGSQCNKFKGDKVKVILEAGQILDEEQLTFLADPGVPDGQAVQTIIPNNVAFQTEDLDTYDSDCDDISNAKAVLMANISNYGSDVIIKIMRYIVIAISFRTLNICKKHNRKISREKIIGIKSLLDAVRITAAHVCVNTAQMELVLLRDFKENMLNCSVEVNAASENMLEVTTASEYQVNAAKAIQADFDVKATYIILQGLPPEVYALVSNHKVAKELWEIIQLLIQGTSLTK